MVCQSRQLRDEQHRVLAPKRPLARPGQSGRGRLVADALPVVVPGPAASVRSRSVLLRYGPGPLAARRLPPLLVRDAGRLVLADGRRLKRFATGKPETAVFKSLKVCCGPLNQ